MAEINIAGFIKELMIFDDPEYCNSSSVIRCAFYSAAYQSCCLYKERNEYGILIGTKILDEYDYKDGYYKVSKCPACKEVYQKSIEKRADDYFDKQPIKTRKL